MSMITQPKRVHYFTGESLNTDDFKTEQYYFLERFRVENISLNIWGLAEGLNVSKDKNDTSTLNISPGLAIDYDGNSIVLSINQSVTLPLPSEIKTYYLIVFYRQEKADYTTESNCGGFKRIIEYPEFKFVDSLSPNTLVLATVDVTESDVILDFSRRRYCSLRLGSLQFASSSDSDGVVSKDLPTINGYYGKPSIDDPDKSATSLLEVSSPLTLFKGKLKIEPYKMLSKSKELIDYLVEVKGNVLIDGLLNVKGDILHNGEIIKESPWEIEKNTSNIYYDLGSVVIGYVPKPENAITEKLSILGVAKVMGDVICTGAGSKFIGDGSGLTNLPNSPWVFGSASGQQNIFYPGLNASSGAAQGAVGIGPFLDLGEVFPPDASLLVKNKTYLEKLSGIQIDGVPEPDPLAITSAVSMKSDVSAATNLSIDAGDLILSSGSINITKGNLTLKTGTLTIDTGSQLVSNGLVTINNTLKINDGNLDISKGKINLSDGDLLLSKGDLTMSDGQFTLQKGSQFINNGDLTVFGNITANKFIGDGSGLTNIGFWSKNNDNSIYADNPTLVCTNQLPVGNNSAFYVNGRAQVTGDLQVEGKIINNVGSSSNYFVTSDEELTTVRGIVDADGNPNQGTGYSSIKIKTGHYQITFVTKFLEVPTVATTVIWEDDGTHTIPSSAIYKLTENGFEVYCGYTLFRDHTFSFIALGPR